MSIECTTSANSTVTCLYSADPAEYVSRVPHSPQNLAGGLDCAPQEPQNNPVAVSPPPPSPLGSTSVSCHRCSVMSVISPRHLAHEVLRPRMSSLSRRVRPVRTVKKRLLPPGTTQVSSSKAGRLLQRPIGDLTGVDAVGHLVDLAGQIGARIVAQMLAGDRQLAGDLAAALALGLGDLHGVTGLAASARSRASFSFSMK